MLFGVATADHQCEAYEARWEDIRDRWERERELTPRGRATDFWVRYREDVELARRLGCTAFRFSVAWARVEPSPGVFDTAVLDHYRELVAAIVAAGMEPVVTLMHYTWPLHVEDEGGLIGDAFPDRFAAYARVVAEALAGQVRWWLTFNEPNQLVYGYLKPWWQGEYRMPPGLPAGAGVEEQLRCARHAMRALFLANARGREAVKAVRADAMVGTNPFMLGLPAWLQRFLDRRAVRLSRSVGSWDASGRWRAWRHPAAGRVDLVAAELSATARRGRDLDFSRPYRVAELRLLVPAGSPIDRAAHARGAVVAVGRGTTAEAAARRLLPGATLRPVADYEAALADLAAGRAAALLADDAILAGLAARDEGRWAIVGEPLRRERYVVGVPTGYRDLLQVVDGVIAGDPPAPLPEAPDLGLRRVLGRGRLRAGVTADVPGLGFRDPETGEWSGQEVELVREVAARLFGDPCRVDLEPLATAERVPALRSWTRVFDPLLRWIDLLLCALDSNWWFLGIQGRLPEWLCPKGCEGQQDYVGVDYYWGVPTIALHRLRQLSDSIAGDFAHAPVWPAAMRRVLREAAAMFPDQPVLVVENGSVPVASGVPRVEYLRTHVREVLRARAEGVPVEGYLCWAITSNREWGLAFGPSNDFGLYHVDLDGDPDLARVPTESVEVYRELIAEATGAGPRSLP